MDPDERAAMARRVAWAWLRAGDIPRARASLTAAGPDAGDAAGWLALYDGDLAAARRLITPDHAHSPDELAAAALLGRTTRDRAPAAGRAFLALARGDSAKAAREFEDAAAESPEAAPLLLDLAARLRAAQGDDAAAIALWSRVVAESPQSPEAPSSDLAWARALRRAHRDNEAIVRLEHLILTYPESALVPQARRELDAAHQALPSTS
jgi:tetratricopeptide (TPR) repeat protein